MTKFKHFLSILFISSVILSANAQSTLKEKLKQHVYTLASDSLQGRQAGTKHSRMASEYIIGQWKEIGIKPLIDSTYLQSFNDGKYQNIVGIIPGNDPILKNEYIVVGAHYDHLGVKKEQIYNGADDNASGVATLTELGRALKANQPNLKRNVILVAFDAEEVGLLGSTYFINNVSIPNNAVKLMISVDMVGWYKASGEVMYEGSATIKDGKTLIVNPRLVPSKLNVVTKDFETSTFTATDTQPFAEKGIPTLAVTTGLKSPYHKPEDDANLIDYDGMALITEHLTNIVEKVSQDTEYASSGKVAQKHSRKQPLFTFGISGNIGSNYHYYTEGALDGKSTTSGGIGLLSQVNFKYFAIRPEVHYDLICAKYPGGKIQTNNLTVPVSLVLQKIKSGVGIDCFFGGYYAYRFGGKQGDGKIDFENTFNRTETGLTYGFGLYARPFKIGFTNRNALTNFTQQPNADNAHIRNRTSYFTITYVF